MHINFPQKFRITIFCKSAIINIHKLIEKVLLIKIMKKFATSLFVLVFIVTATGAISLLPSKAMAASVTSASATLGRIEATGANDSGTIQFATPTGIQTGGADTIILTFSSDFVLVGESAVNFDIELGDSATCSTAVYTDKTVALNASGTEWGIDVTGDVLTLSPDTDETLTAGFCMRLVWGTAATTGGTGSASTMANGGADDDDSVAITGGFGDTGTIAIDIITDDSVNITATVSPTITFSISDVAIGFGALDATAARYATADATGTGVLPGDTTGAHEMTIATNAASGYSITYFGATLTSGANTINVATIASDADGTPASEQFALGIDDNGGNVTIASAYELAGTNSYAFVAGTTTTIASETIATATETIDVQYIANIATTTEAGSYSTDVTYIATGNF